MALHTLPVDADDGAYTVDVALSGRLYRMLLCWNTRAERWAFSLFTSADEPLITGVPLVGDWELASQYQDPRLPPGRFYTVDTRGEGLPPSRDNLGKRFLLVYDDGE